MIQLRTYTFLDSLQPQLASYMAATCRGYLPVAGEASLWIEIAPGMEINRITDVAQKSTNVKPAVQVVERAFGILEVHAEKQDSVLEAGRQILSYLKMSERMRKKPSIKTNEIITGVNDHQAMLINRTRKGNMLLGGQTLFILEVQPAGYAMIAANEAEKATHLSLVDIQPIGAFGRLYLAGTDSQIQEAQKAAINAIEQIAGEST